MIDYTLLKEIILISVTSSVISNAFVQKFKDLFKCKSHICLGSLIVSFLLSVFFSISFTNLGIVYSIWVGVLSIVGSDAIYLSIEKGIFKNIGKK